MDGNVAQIGRQVTGAVFGNSNPYLHEEGKDRVLTGNQNAFL